VAPTAHSAAAHKTCGLMARTAAAAAAAAVREAADPELSAAMAVKRTREHFARDYRLQVCVQPQTPTLHAAANNSQKPVRRVCEPGSML